MAVFSNSPTRLKRKTYAKTNIEMDLFLVHGVAEVTAKTKIGKKVHRIPIPDPP
jgi:hypothetical protein